MDLIRLKERIEMIPGVEDGGVTIVRLSVDPVGQVHVYVTADSDINALSAGFVILKQWPVWYPKKTSLPDISVTQNIVSVSFVI